MEDKVFKLEFTEQQLAVVEAGLKELPGKICLPVLNVLFKQISDQMEKQKTPMKAMSTEEAHSKLEEIKKHKK